LPAGGWNSGRLHFHTIAPARTLVDGARDRVLGHLLTVEGAIRRGYDGALFEYTLPYLLKAEKK
jgi:hypothetical protein